jgi:hypothetical protein
MKTNITMSATEQSDSKEFRPGNRFLFQQAPAFLTRLYDLPMDSIPKTRLIRQYIRSALLQLGDPHPAPVIETLLIRDGVYCGHRFCRNDYQAVWFIEENQVKFYGPGGELLHCFDAVEVMQQYSPQAA